MLTDIIYPIASDQNYFREYLRHHAGYIGTHLPNTTSELIINPKEGKRSQHETIEKYSHLQHNINEYYNNTGKKEKNKIASFNKPPSSHATAKIKRDRTL